MGLLTLPGFAWAQDAPKASPYDSAHFSWRKPVPRNRLREMQPDRPGVTESPFTVDAGHMHVEIDALRLSNSGTGKAEQQRDWSVAYTLLKLGLGRRTDVQLELPVYAVAKRRPTGTREWQDRHTGFGDVGVRLKHNFLGEAQDGSFALAAIGFVRLPTGGTTGTGGTEYGLIVPVDFELSSKANLEIQMMAAGLYNREAGRYLSLTPSIALEYDFFEKLGLITEAVAQWDTAGRRWEPSVNIAPLLKLAPNVQLDAGTHLALSRLADRQYFAGITLRR
ncbi:hypothetical protein BEN47_16450 [Hymenobacter lapidarius]|uniref:Transporter n=2 Tax=Hymenobacter lapidarius TaxID=1908237 RepID=A0A1G1T036_9BACT|nr:hypothetical protein BEN47_16450 [Hymenobacter lapidarius]